MKAQVEIITPTAAKDLLAANPANRKISRTTVERYTSDMKADRWTNNGQGIVISETGELLDGQHRMLAVLAAGKSIGMLVVRGVDKGAFVTMDTGKARSLADLLSIEGCVNTNTLSAMARSVYCYVAGVSQSFNPTKSTLNEFILANPYLQEVSSQVTKLQKVRPPAPVAAVLFLGNHRRNLDGEVESFLDGIVYGERMRRGDPRYTFREWVSAERLRARGYMSRESVFAAAGRAWNAYASGKELDRIRGVDKPTQMSLALFGFNRLDFASIPNLREIQQETARGNLAKVRFNRKPSVVRSSPTFAVAAR